MSRGHTKTAFLVAAAFLCFFRRGRMFPLSVCSGWGCLVVVQLSADIYLPGLVLPCLPESGGCLCLACCCRCSHSQAPFIPGELFRRLRCGFRGCLVDLPVLLCLFLGVATVIGLGRDPHPPILRCRRRVRYPPTIASTVFLELEGSGRVCPGFPYPVSGQGGACRARQSGKTPPSGRSLKLP